MILTTGDLLASGSIVLSIDLPREPLSNEIQKTARSCNLFKLTILA